MRARAAPRVMPLLMGMVGKAEVLESLWRHRSWVGRADLGLLSACFSLLPPAETS